MTKGLARAVAAAVALSLPSLARAGLLAGPYVAPAQLQAVPFGAHSHWAQPWRAYLETVPASTYLQALGVNLDLSNGEDPNLVCRMLARNGIRAVRLEIPFGKLDFASEQLSDQKLHDLIAACGAHGIRPLILLSAPHAAPCPMKRWEVTVLAPAAKGSTQVQLSDTTGISSGRTGLSDLSEPWAAEVMIEAIGSYTAYLSKPLPVALAQDRKVTLTTLKYAPFGPPWMYDYEATTNAWLRYVKTVVDFVASATGNTSSDRGLDLEIWDELDGHNRYLYMNQYWDPPLWSYPEGDIRWMLVQSVSDLFQIEPSYFNGVRLSDGFGSGMPWPASSTEPVGVRALSKQPAPTRRTYPADEPSGSNLNADYAPDTWVPSYTALFPELRATMLDPESVTRDMAPLTTKIDGTAHGRDARVPYDPVPVWITEMGFSPAEQKVTDPGAAAALKARVTARTAAFYVGKGAERLMLFAAAGGSAGTGLLSDEFLALARTSTEYPPSDGPYTSPALATLARMAARIGQAADPVLGRGATRKLTVQALSDAHDHVQFEGDGTAAHPPLYDRDVFAFLPFQANEHRFVIAYYVMTRDVTQAFTPEKFVVSVGGLDGRNALVSVEDPVSGAPVSVNVLGAAADRIAVELTASDYPYLLTVQEDPTNVPPSDGGVTDGGIGDGSPSVDGGVVVHKGSGGCGCTTSSEGEPATLLALMLAAAALSRAGRTSAGSGARCGRGRGRATSPSRPRRTR